MREVKESEAWQAAEQQRRRERDKERGESQQRRRSGVASFSVAALEAEEGRLRRR